jgi:hypothetical protein
MNSLRLFSISIIMLCLSSSWMKAGLAAKEEAPQGYEDAPVAEATMPVAQQQPQASRPSAVAPTSGGTWPKDRARPKKIKKEDVPQGYEDAPEANAKPANARPALAVAPARLMPAGGFVPAGAGIPAPIAPVGVNGEAAKGGPEGQVDPRVIQMERQYRPRFEQMLQTELAFIRRTCDLDKTQREAVANAGKQCVSSVLRQCAITMQKMNNGVPMAQVSKLNARKLLREQLAIAVTKSVRPEQLKQFRRESDERDASWKRAVVHYVVAKLDRRLVLSAEQREKMTLAFTKNYSDEWEQFFPLWLQNDEYMPSFLESQVTPLLDQNQKNVWQGIQKIGGYWSGDMGLSGLDMGIIDEQQGVQLR